MKIYFAGAENYIDDFANLNIKNILISYAFIKKKKIDIKPSFFIDSGAFTVMTTGKAIDLDDYCSFLKNCPAKSYAGLDVIGNPEQTFKNCEYMKSLGLSPIPTFHYGSDFSYFEKLVKEYDYIALGGLVPLKSQTRAMNIFLKRCFLIIKDSKRKIKVHGFGLNNWKFLCTFPFYSVDATSWQNPSRYNQIFRFEKGKLSRFSINKKTRFLLVEHIMNRKEANLLSALAIKQAEDYLTRLWAVRGIVWKDN